MTLIIAIHNYVHCTIEYTTCTFKFMSIDVHPMVLKAHQLKFQVQHEEPNEMKVLSSNR